MLQTRVRAVGLLILGHLKRALLSTYLKVSVMVTMKIVVAGVGKWKSSLVLDAAD